MSDPSSPIRLEEASPLDSPTTSTEQRYQRRRSTFLLKCLVVVSILSNTVLATIIILKWSNKDKQDINNESKSEAQRGTKEGVLCFTCNFLGPEIGSNDTLYEVYRVPKGQMCCLKGENHVASLFQTILRGEFTNSFYAFKQGMPAMSEIFGGIGAHLYMTVHGSVAHWTGVDKYNTAFCSGLTCREGNITITEEGTYLVYSFISIQSFHQISEKNLLHIIYRKNPILAKIGERKLLFGKSSPGRNGRHTSFMAATLTLRKNDVLRVGLSQNYYHYVDKRPLTNYFGVIKV